MYHALDEYAEVEYGTDREFDPWEEEARRAKEEREDGVLGQFLDFYEKHKEDNLTMAEIEQLFKEQL